MIWIAISVGLVGVVAGLAFFLVDRSRPSPHASGADLARAGRARDADGRTVKLLDPVPLMALGRHEVVEAEALEAICQDLEPGIGGRRTLLLTVALVGFGALALVGATVAIKGRAALTNIVGTLFNPAIIACLAGGVIAPFFATRQQRLTRVREVMLHHERCPHCGYGLTGVPPRPDGAVVCPECSAAWHLGDGAVIPPRTPPATPRSATTMLIMLGGGLAAMAAALALYLVMR